MSFRDRSGRMESQVSRVREQELERDVERHTIEHPDPPADDPRTRGVMARVRRLLRRRGRRPARP